MKKALIALLLTGLVIATGCSGGKDAAVFTQDTAVISTEAPTEVVTEAPTGPPVDTTAFFKDMSGKYVCTTGTKGGATLYLSTDGSFVGYYVYSANEIRDENSELGVYLYSRFSCEMQNVLYVDEGIYSTDISELNYESEPGTEEMRNGVRYIYTAAQHIASYDEFYIFSPKVKISQLPDDSMYWLNRNGIGLQDKDEEIGKYLLYNQKSGETFYQAEKTELVPGEPYAESEQVTEHTGEELLNISISEIVGLMNNEITVKNDRDCGFVTPMGYVYFYNTEQLPGFFFFIQPKNRPNIPQEYFLDDELAAIKEDILSGKYDELNFIAITDGAELNSKINSNMTYTQISSTIAEYSTNPMAGPVEITQDVTSVCGGVVHATVKYETSSVDDLQRAYDQGQIVNYMMQDNPKVRCIIASNS